ncbi:hypothetical protein PanWU01x14_245020 [Parasponia andersonii]|uniref:Uncharacterized protein n=1 Tax=Parasponia andersonii TaxID=3476 RepID=A0A2P5BEV6_PARAD|nr:hypothetical protein PanWU01x14_245020 [Parasponia andersonii]
MNNFSRGRRRKLCLESSSNWLRGDIWYSSSQFPSVLEVNEWKEVKLELKQVKTRDEELK